MTELHTKGRETTAQGHQMKEASSQVHMVLRQGHSVVHVWSKGRVRQALTDVNSPASVPSSVSTMEKSLMLSCLVKSPLRQASTGEE